MMAALVETMPRQRRIAGDHDSHQRKEKPKEARESTPRHRRPHRDAWEVPPPCSGNDETMGGVEWQLGFIAQVGRCEPPLVLGVQKAQSSQF
jgi:hypothetical protein